MSAKPVYVTKAHFDKTLADLEMRLDAKLDAKLAAFGTALRNDLAADLASHVRAVQEWLATMIKAVDEKYADVPGRVAARGGSFNPLISRVPGDGGGRGLTGQATRVKSAIPNARGA